MKTNRRVSIIVILFLIIMLNINGNAGDTGIFNFIDNVAQVAEVVEETGNLSGEGLGQLGIGLHTVVPRGNYKSQNDNLGFGLGVDLGAKISGTPLIIGIDAVYAYFGSEDWSRKMSYAVFGSDLDVSTWYKIGSGYIFLRLQSDYSALQPYIEGLVGANYLWSTTNIDEGFDDDDVSIEFDDLALSWGLGAGAMLPLFVTKESPRHGIFINLNMRYLFGGEAEYLKSGSKHLVGNNIVYDVTKSRTDMFSLRLGVTFNF